MPQVKKIEKKKGRDLEKRHVVHRKPIAIPCDHVVMGQVVLCKMKGHCEWPAKVTGFKDNLKCIEFFGDHTTHEAALCNYFNFEDSHEVILANLRSKKGLYTKNRFEKRKFN